MTLAKAQACLAAITGAGFDGSFHLDPVTGDWTVRASSATLNIDSTQISALAGAQAVFAKTSLVEFS